MAIQKVTFTHEFVGDRVARPGTGNLMLIGARDPAATLGAGIVKKYRSPSQVKNDHGEGSVLHEAARIAVQNISQFRAVSFADATVANAAQRTFGAASSVSTGQIVAADRPIYELTSATIDGVAYASIIYTPLVAGALAAFNFTGYTLPAIAINPDTGEFKSSASTAGNLAGIVLTYKVADTEGLYEQLLTHPFEVVTFAGLRFSAQNIGLWRELVDWADLNDKMVYAATEDGILPTNTSFQGLVAYMGQRDNFQLLATKLVDPNKDATTAYAAQQTRSPPNGTLKNQLAPRGLIYDASDIYTRSEFGDDVEPNVGEFHYLGVNAITSEDGGGSFVHSSDRLVGTYSVANNTLFGGTRRTVNAVNALVDFEATKTLTRSPTSALFDVPGLAAVKSAFETGLTIAAGNDLRYIDPDFTLTFPTLADTSETERKQRTLNGVEYNMRVVNPIHTVDAA